MGYDPLLPLRSGGSERPLFCIHPAGGSSTVFGSIAQHLPDNLPAYGLQAKALSGAGAGHSSIREMADCYVQAMRRVQPQGPYRLLGWSFGGIVLQEMAAQLEANGESLEIGLLLDSGLSGDDFSDLKPREEAELLTKQAEAFGISAQGLTGETLKAELLLEAKRRGLMPQAAEIGEVELMLQIMRQTPVLVARWAGCPRLSAPITFIRASDNGRSDLQDRLAALTSGSVRIFDVAAPHNRMCDQEHSETMARIVQAILSLQ
jgi:thioesterase domain-containing protein